MKLKCCFFCSGGVVLLPISLWLAADAEQWKSRGCISKRQRLEVPHVWGVYWQDEDGADGGTFKLINKIAKK